MKKWSLVTLVLALLGANRALGSEEQLAPYELRYLAKHLLSALGADTDIQIYKTDRISHSTSTCIRMNPSFNRLGPIEYIMAHECGHIAGNHCSSPQKTGSAARAVEKEADLFAAQALHDLGLDRFVFERIADLRLYIPYESPSPEDSHPSMAENAEYLTEFMIDQGYTREYIDGFCQRIIPLRAKELGISILA